MKMVDFSKIKQKEIRAQSIIFKLEIELNKCGLTPDELATRMEYLINTSSDRATCEFINMLMRVAKASTWDLHKLEVI